MKNTKLLQSKQDFNRFTNALRKKIVETNAPVVATLRNGQLIQVLFNPGSDTEFAHFCSLTDAYVWEPDGSSVTSSRFDLIEF